MKTLLIITILVTSLFLSALEVNHDLPASLMSGDVPEIKLDVREGFETTDSVTLYYKETGNMNFSEILMEKGTETDPVFSISLEEVANYKTGLAYYFSILSTDGTTITLPADQPDINPYRVAIMLPAAEKEDSFVRLSPDPDYAEKGNSFIIAISYYAIEDEIDLSTIRFYLNNKDVTDETEISKNLLIYNVENTSYENVKYDMEAKLKTGEEVRSDAWFTKTSVKSYEMPMNMKGKATANFNTGSDSRADEAVSNGNFRLDLQGRQNWFRFKTKLYISSLEDKYKQPVNRYNLGLFVPHFDLIFGDYSPNLSTYTVSGRNVRGVYSKLNFTGFRVFASFGQSKRSIDGTDDYTAGTFQRNNLGIRVESGNPKRFTFGVTVAKNKDVISSLDEKYYFAEIDTSTTFQDTSGVYHPEQLVKPEDNLVIATDIRMAYKNQRFVFGAELAGSLHNTNIINGSMTHDEIKDYTDVNIPVDPVDFEGIMVVNEHMIPFLPSFSNLAYKTYFRAFFAGNLLNISYSGIGSAFNSLSTNVSRTDTGIFSLSDNLNFLDNQASVGLNLNYVYDNLYQTKETTTTSMTYNAMAAYRSNVYPVFFSFSFNNNLTENPGTQDSLAFAANTNNFNVSTGYTVETIPAAPTKFSVGFGNFVSKDIENSSYENTNSNIVFSADSKFDDLPLRTTISFTTNMYDNSSVNDITYKEYNYNSLFVKGQMKFAADKVKTYLSMRFSGFSGDKQINENYYNLGGSYNITKNTFVSSDIGVKSIEYTIPNDEDYSLFNFRFKVSKKF